MHGTSQTRETVRERLAQRLFQKSKTGIKIAQFRLDAATMMLERNRASSLPSTASVIDTLLVRRSSRSDLSLVVGGWGPIYLRTKHATSKRNSFPILGSAVVRRSSVSKE